MTIARILAEKGRNVSTIQPHRTIAEVLQILAVQNIGAVVVTDSEGGVLGILSERDIVRALGRDGASALDDAASKYMTAKVITTLESECVSIAMEKMTTRRFRHLPVVKDGKLAGLVSIGDLVKFRLAEMEQQHEALKEYIATA
ncbi:putative signal transduction protein with CBS domains [Methylocella silvestris BL2]|uniref:Putative signal transduction protein with CBS domains n=1 Tax=Methylocella silvestris (strain DSM 15510 / CIP 108128 / LMG 27833 / NCIMB 13906 / BL2) TaxID=395965 RepID=B8EQR0_METSB|nr:CBS domain-containing protein [Methylocella silvestris]ACK49331.1 putative signal transduction protein with CBS domains [Methylocella silvestris BL2]